MTSTYTVEKIAAFVDGYSNSAIQKDLRDLVARHLLDSIGCAIGAIGAKVTHDIKAVVDAFGGAEIDDRALAALGQVVAIDCECHSLVRDRIRSALGRVGDLERRTGRKPRGSTPKVPPVPPPTSEEPAGLSTAVGSAAGPHEDQIVEERIPRRDGDPERPGQEAHEEVEGDAEPAETPRAP